MKKLLVICLSFFLLGLQSCENSKTLIEDLKDLVERVDKESEESSTEEWNELMDEYNLIEEKLTNYEYTDEELEEIGRLKGKMLGIIARSTYGEFERTLNDLGKQLKSGVDAFLDEISGEKTDE